MKEKLKVVWICHFSNEFVRSELGVKKNVRDFASWITLGIAEAKKRDDIDLHIVSPHRWISGISEFTQQNIHYHFFNPEFMIFNHYIPGDRKSVV